MKKLKLIFVVVMLIVVLSVLSFGVYTGLKANTGIINQVNFNKGDENVFVEINSKYQGPNLKEGISPTYYFKASRDEPNAYTDRNILPPWILGETNFTTLKTEISLTFTIKNINGSGSLLNVSVSEFAFDTEGKFEVSYLIANDEDSLESATQTIISDENQIITLSIEDGQSQTFQLVYKLKQFDTKFQFDNNVKILLENVVSE